MPLDDLTKIRILAAYAAVHEDKDLQSALTALGGMERQAVQDAWVAIGADKLLRKLAQQSSTGGEVELRCCGIVLHNLSGALRKLAQQSSTRGEVELASLEQKGSELFWKGKTIGKICLLYKAPLPEEWQARIAYESFIDRFVAYLQREAKVILLSDNPSCQRFYCPNGELDLTTHWERFVQFAFSASELHKTFVSLLNSVTLSERGGFSVLNVPILSKAQAQVLAGFYVASVEERRRSLERRKNNLDDLAKQIKQAQSQGNTNKLEDLKARLNKGKREFKNQRKRYKPSIQEMYRLAKDQDMKDEFAEVRKYATWYVQTARRQLKVTKNVVEKCVSEVERLLRMKEEEYASLPPLVSTSMQTLFSGRTAGDYSANSCYVCGRSLQKSDCFETNKFIAPSPSQALQSRSAQESPRVCVACAALSVVSPIKLTNDSFAVRLRNTKTQSYLLEDRLRMFLLAELNLVAGRYAMLTCTEKVGKDSLLRELSKVPYALWKVAALFPAEVFRAYEVEAVIDGTQLTLPGRHLTWLSALMQVFRDLKTPHRIADKGKLSAIKRAIRHIQRDEMIFAVYELARSFKKAGYSSVEATRLEELRALHVQWLENDPSNITGRKAQMEEHVRKAQVFRDVAGLTGILYAFVTRVRNETDSSSAEREVKKLIEKVDEPYHFIYDAAGSLRSGDAKLWRRPSTHFIYDQAKALLSEACIEVREENTGWGKWIRWQVARIFGCAIVISRESGESALKFYFDDLVKVYDHLFKTRYTTEKDRRYLTYQVKLSLYARFPEYLGGEGG